MISYGIFHLVLQKHGKRLLKKYGHPVHPTSRLKSVCRARDVGRLKIIGVQNGSIRRHTR